MTPMVGYNEQYFLDTVLIPAHYNTESTTLYFSFFPIPQTALVVLELAV